MLKKFNKLIYLYSTGILKKKQEIIFSFREGYYKSLEATDSKAYKSYYLFSCETDPRSHYKKDKWRINISTYYLYHLFYRVEAAKKLNNKLSDIVEKYNNERTC